MVMTPEKKVKDKVTKILKELKAWYFLPVSAGYGVHGIPDIIGCYKGKFFGIECKAGKNTATPLQRRQLNAISNSEGISLVINEGNISEVADRLTGIVHDDRQYEMDFGE
jgi:hypothetical protein